MESSHGQLMRPGPTIEPSHPFISNKPPAIDPFMYLTLIEETLTRENVQVLRHVLQKDVDGDGTLFNDIGWDLVRLLLAFIDEPAAQATLLDIGRLGNPKECALKVEEALRAIDWDEDVDGETDEDGEEEEQANVHPAMRKSMSDAEPKNTSTGSQNSEQAKQVSERSSQPSLKFATLVKMLASLHPRIAVKQPSRFMATTLSAILAAMAGASPGLHEYCIEAAIGLVEDMRKSQRVSMLPRSSSSSADPNGYTQQAPNITSRDAAIHQNADDAQIQHKLLQSFVTHLVELWMSSLDGSMEEEIMDIPGLAWAARFQEQEQPQMVVPDRVTVTQQFEQLPSLQTRNGYCSRLSTLASSLDLTVTEILTTACKDDSSELTENSHAAIENGKLATGEEDEESPPEKPEDVPLSQAGSLFLLACKLFSQSFPATQMDLQGQTAVEFQIFPHVAGIVRQQIGSPEGVMISTSALPSALLDSILFLALLALSRNAIGNPDHASSEDRDAFPRFLQTTSLLSANAPSPSIRYCAHVVTATVLRSHPDPAVRLTFIKDSLENAPMNLLKSEAVGWLKGEILEANLASEGEEDHSIFRTSMALDSVSMYLYPDLRTLVEPFARTSQDEAASGPTQLFTEIIKTRLPFLLAVLNFHYLLLSMPSHIRERLDIVSLHTEADVGAAFLTPLRGAAQQIDAELNRAAPNIEREEMQQMRSDIMLLQGAIEHVDRRVIAVAKEGR